MSQEKARFLATRKRKATRKATLPAARRRPWVGLVVMAAVAVTVLAAILATNRGTTESFFDQGLAKFQLGQYQDAIADFDQAIQLQPDNADAYYNRGLAKLHLEQFEATILDYDRAVQLQPDNANAYYNRGLAKFHLERYEDAVDDFGRAVLLCSSMSTPPRT